MTTLELGWGDFLIRGCIGSIWQRAAADGWITCV